MQVTGFDHLLLTVAPIGATCAFYVHLLGMRRHSFAGGRMVIHLGDHKINLHEKGREFEPKSLHPTPGSGDLYFVVADLEDTMRERRKPELTLGWPGDQGGRAGRDEVALYSRSRPQSDRVGTVWLKTSQWEKTETRC